MLETMIFSLLSDCVIVLILEIKVSRIRSSVCLWFLNSGNYFGILGWPEVGNNYFFLLKDSKIEKKYTNFSNRRCKFSISPTRCSDRRYSCCKSSASRGLKRFLKTDLMTIFYSSPRKNCKKPREKSIFYSLSIRGVAEVALNQCS